MKGFAVGNNGTILRTVDGGDNWTENESGTLSSLFSIFFWNPDSGTVVGSEGTILHTTDGGVTSVRQTEGVMPDRFRLEQNYPNPFNPTTQFRLSVTETGLVTLTVFDLLGREVAVLLREELPPGEYTQSFSAGDLASGIYIYQLQAGSHVATKRFVLLK
jgi:hypothetical protein